MQIVEVVYFYTRQCRKLEFRKLLFNYNNLIRTLYTFLMDLADLTKFYKPLGHIYLDYNYFITI